MTDARITLIDDHTSAQPGWSRQTVRLDDEPIGLLDRHDMPAFGREPARTEWLICDLPGRAPEIRAFDDRDEAIAALVAYHRAKS